MTGTGRAMANTPVMAQKHPTNFPPARVDKIETINGKLTDIYGRTLGRTLGSWNSKIAHMTYGQFNRRSSVRG